jgi:hypothetical protein
MKASDLRFVPISQNLGGSSVLYTEAQQQEAFDKFIDQDAYLSTKRGQYVDRNENLYPCYRVDLSTRFQIRKSFQFADIFEFHKLVKSYLGESYIQIF